jgi:hypothetical protein
LGYFLLTNKAGTQIPGYLHYPRAKVLISAQGIYTRKNLCQRLLGQVFGVVNIADQTEAYRKDTVSIGLDQGLACRPVAHAARLD